MAKKRATIDWRFIFGKRLSGPGRAPRASREDSPTPRVVCTVEWCPGCPREPTARGVCLSIQSGLRGHTGGRGPCERETESERVYNIFSCIVLIAFRCALQLGSMFENWAQSKASAEYHHLGILSDLFTGRNRPTGGNPGRSTGGRVSSDLCKQTCSGPESTYLLPSRSDYRR